ncbi:immunoglobulin lambda-1 light chain isoform X4 [Haplochromis burtoni]|uniref:immunoglobulin lambda-1 light chain isoform X4 n=1 Tax=Haplochromis burtoni TaxID=8153 RepID=UPI001C2D7E6E|nr:immunoglobulin lambda-1 light chain isoform X4 [Haplochromis burtoni]
MAPPAPFLQFLVHIDIMLATLCALITALTCVSGVTVVTQKPVLSVRKGETATMDCNLGTVTDSAARWYKQIPGGVPQYVLRFRHDWSSPTYGSGFSSPKFTSTHQSTTDYRLIISNVEEGDSAVYYCQTYDTSVNEHVFGQGTKLIVTSSSLPPPVLTVFPPSSAELQSDTASLVCLSSQSVPFADVSWLAAGSPVSSGISTSTAVQRPDQTYQISSSLTIQTSDWNMNKVYTCKVSLASQTSEKTIKKSECPTE